MDENELSRHIVVAALTVHKTLGGPGLLESVYEAALDWEMRDRGLEVQRQVELPIVYKGHDLGQSFRLDMLVGGLVIVECKATRQTIDLYKAQTLTYLRVSRLRLGLLINFGERLIKHGIHRIVNGL